MSIRTNPVVLGALALSTAILAGPAVAKLSLKQKKQAKAQDAQLEEELKYTNDKCGTKIKAKIDWRSFEKSPAFAEGSNYSVSGYCAPPLGVIRVQCQKDDVGKKAAKKIKSVTCKHAPKDKRSIKLKKGKLTWGAEFDRANADDYVKAYLLDKLGLKEARAIKYQEEKFQEEIDWTNKKCGTSLKWKIDWKSFRKQKFMESNYSVHGYCDGVLSGIESVCADPDGKEAIQESVKTVVCKLSGKKKLRKVTLKKGKLTWTFGWDAANTGDFTKEWLMGNL